MGWTQGRFRELLGQNCEVLDPVGVCISTLYVAFISPRLYNSQTVLHTFSVLSQGEETDNFFGLPVTGGKSQRYQIQRERREEGVAFWGGLAVSRNSRGAGVNSS